MTVCGSPSFAFGIIEDAQLREIDHQPFARRGRQHELRRQHDLASFARQPRIDAGIRAHDLFVAEIEAARDVGERVFALARFVTCSSPTTSSVAGSNLKCVRRDRRLDRAAAAAARGRLGLCGAGTGNRRRIEARTPGRTSAGRSSASFMRAIMHLTERRAVSDKLVEGNALNRAADLSSTEPPVDQAARCDPSPGNAARSTPRPPARLRARRCCGVAAARSALHRWQTSAHSCALTRPLKPRSATISTSWSAQST